APFPVAALTLAIWGAHSPQGALAANECGVVPAGGAAACAASGNPYASGITYTDIGSVDVEAGVVVESTGVAGIEAVTTDQPLTVTVADGVTISAADHNRVHGINAWGKGPITVDSGADIAIAVAAGKPSDGYASFGIEAVMD